MKEHGCKDCGEERIPQLVAGRMRCPECGSVRIVSLAPDQKGRWDAAQKTIPAVDESDKKELERGLFGEDPDSILNDNQYRAIKCIVEERDELEADVGQAHHILDLMNVPRKDSDAEESTLTLLGRMRKLQSGHKW